MNYEQKINKVINQLKGSVNEGPAESKSIDKIMMSLMDMGRKLKDMKQRKQLAVALSAVSDLRNMLKESVNEETLTEGNVKVIPADKITSKNWRQMKYDLRDQFDELVKVGEDFGVFASAQGTHRMLKQIKKIMDKI